MFQIKTNLNFDSAKLLKEAGNAAAEEIKQKCQRAARPFGGVTVTIKRDARGFPANLSFAGSEEAITAAKNALK